jgi:hypothetical protein
MEVPDIQYTRSGDVAIAYQVVGTAQSTWCGFAAWPATCCPPGISL